MELKASAVSTAASASGLATSGSAFLQGTVLESVVIGLIAGVLLFAKEISYLNEDEKNDLDIFKAFTMLFGTIFITISVATMVAYGGVAIAPFGLDDHMFWSAASAFLAFNNEFIVTLLQNLISNVGNKKDKDDYRDEY